MKEFGGFPRLAWVRTCATCGEENLDTARFCVQCGAPLAVCVACGAGLSPDVRFCPACGTQVPESLLPGEERKRVTVLFADLAGSTGLGEQLDPEHLKEVMDSFFQKMRAELEAEGGTVEKYIGDAVMAVFGVPAVHEDDATRALRAALRMRRALDRLNRSLEESHGIRLAMRTGVNTGEVVARTVPRPGQGLVTGDAVNVAARLEQRAESGQILVGERTARAARGLRLEPIGPLTLKGKEEPVVAYEVLDDEVTAPGSGRRGETGRYRAPLVGRHEELRVLKSVFERSVSERRSHLVTVFGDAGVGKSRLVEEFGAWAQALPEPALAIGGRCLPYGEGVTYWPLAQILKGWAGVLDSDEPETALDRLRQAVGKLLADVPDVAEPEELTAALAFTVGLRDPAWPVEEDPREARAATHEAWRIFLSSLARPRPVVAVIEDIHWADPALLELLQELAEHSEGPLMFVCPARPELTARRPDWGGGRWNYSSLLLEPLSRGDAGDLLDLLLVDAGEVPGSLRARILERAGGNPFFLEEIVLHLMQEHPGPEIENVQIPDTVQGVLAARMDLLPASEKRVLQTASVVGRTFWNGAVASILDGEDRPQDLDDILWRLEDRGLVHARIGSTIVGRTRVLVPPHPDAGGGLREPPTTRASDRPRSGRGVDRATDRRARARVRRTARASLRGGLPWGPRNVPAGGDRQGATEGARVPPRDARRQRGPKETRARASGAVRGHRFVDCRGNARACGRARGARHDVLPRLSRRHRLGPSQRGDRSSSGILRRPRRGLVSLPRSPVRCRARDRHEGPGDDAAPHHAGGSGAVPGDRSRGCGRG